MAQYAMNSHVNSIRIADENAGKSFDFPMV